jgi:polyhydroxyalkanoate synthesis regulator protein
VLSKKEERMINLEFLSERIHFFGHIMAAKTSFPEWEKFSQEFKNLAGKMNSEAFHDQSRGDSLNSKQTNGINTPLDAPAEIKREINSLMWILNNKFNSKKHGLEVSELSYAIFDYLDFIEIHYFPHIIKETSYNEFGSFDQFQKQKDLIILLSKTLESFAMEKCFLNLFSSHVDHQILTYYADDFESVLEKYHKKSISKFYKFHEAYKKFEGTNHISDWLDIEGPAGDLKYTFEIGESNIEAMDKLKTEITIARKKNLENDTSNKRHKVM